MNKKTVLYLGLAAAALYFMSRPGGAFAAQGYGAGAGNGMLPPGAMNPQGFADPNAWWESPAAALINGGMRQIFNGGGSGYYADSGYPIGGMNPQGFPTQMY